MKNLENKYLSENFGTTKWNAENMKLIHSCYFKFAFIKGGEYFP